MSSNLFSDKESFGPVKTLGATLARSLSDLEEERVSLYDLAVGVGTAIQYDMNPIDGVFTVLEESRSFPASRMVPNSSAEIFLHWLNLGYEDALKTDGKYVNANRDKDWKKVFF